MKEFNFEHIFQLLSIEDPTVSDRMALINALQILCYDFMDSEETVATSVKALNTACTLVKPLLGEELADVFWLIWIQINEKSAEVSQKNCFFRLIMECVSNSLVPSSILLTRLTPEVLEQIGEIPNATAFKKKMVKIRTQKLYAQTKFNLLHEENEGFSKVASLLIETSSCDSVDISGLKQRIQSIVGYFDLDPNRLIDLILTSFENNLHRDFHLSLLRLFNQTSICHVLGFKFGLFESEETPQSLVQLAALLIHNDIVNLEEFYGHIKPSDDDLFKHREDFVEKIKSKVVSSNITSISSLTLDDGQEIALETNAVQNIERVASSRVNDITMEGAFDSCHLQKLLLLASLLNIGNRTSSIWLLKKLSNAMPASYSPVASGIIKQLDELIDPVYSLFASNHRILNSSCDLPDHMEIEKVYSDDDSSDEEEDGSLSMNTMRIATEVSVPSSTELADTLLPLLSHLRQFLFQAPKLFAKICRTFAHLISREEADVPCQQLTDIICLVLFPSFSLLPSNTGISNDLWSLIKLFPYQLRYTLYSYWSDVVYSSSPELIFAKCTTIRRTKYFRKRISKQNIRQCARSLIRLSHSNPIISLDLILDQIQAYDNMINVVVDTFKYLTPLAHDIVPFLLLNYISSPQEKLKADGVNIAHSFQSLASFVGAYYRRYADVEVGAILRHVVDTLKDERSLDLILLKELVSSAANIEAVEDVSDIQLLGQSGGKTLRAETAAFRSEQRHKKRSVSSLLNSLKRQKMFLPIVVLLAQQKNSIIYNTDTPYVRLIAELYDRCQDVLIQFLEFLSTYVSSDASFAAFLAPIQELVSEYHVSIGDAFAITRPVIKIPFNCGIAEETSAGAFSLLAKTCSSFLPDDTWLSISPEFYAIFWSFSMYDIYVPITYYAQSIFKLSEQAKQIENQDDARVKHSHDKIIKSINRLDEETNSQLAHHDQILSWLNAHKNDWFSSCTQIQNAAMVFIQHCILPRCFFSAIDALYCAKFVLLLTSIGTPHFNIIHVFHQAFSCLGSVLASATSNESSRFGRFLNELLVQADKWSVESEFNKDSRLPGFAIDFKNGEEKLTFEGYKRFHFKFHTIILRSFKNALTSKQDIDIHNALLVLNKIGTVFPKLESIGEVLEKLMKKVSDEAEKGTSLKVLAARSQALLMSQRKHWMNDNSFANQSTVTPDAKNDSIARERSTTSATSKSRLVEREKGRDHKYAPRASLDSHKRPLDKYTEQSHSKRPMIDDYSTHQPRYSHDQYHRASSRSRRY